MNLQQLKNTVRRPIDRVFNPVLGSITHVQTERPEVVLTFDDGPLPGVTEKLAEVLADHQARAVFFVLLTRVRRAPGLIRDLAAAGHEIALHGLDHRRLPSLSTAESDQWLRTAHHDLQQSLGAPVQWFRPPHGAQSPRTHRQASKLGLTTVLWSGTTWDWKDVPHEQRVAKALADSTPGAILLAHDGAADASDLAVEQAAITVDKPALLQKVLTGLHDRGLRAVTLSESLRGAQPVRRLSFAR